MAGKHPEGKNSPQAKRLRHLREVMEYDFASRFAEDFVGIIPQRWNNFEVGHPLSRDVAARLVAKIPGITLDWLETGNPNGLSIEMARKLGELPRSQRGRGQVGRGRTAGKN